MPRLPALTALTVAAVLALCAVGAEARPRPRPAEPPILAELEIRATDCFAETVMSNPKATAAAREGKWYKAASVTGFLCRPEVDDLMRAREAFVRRPGAGLRWFKGVYAARLDQALAERLAPRLARKALADADPAQLRDGDEAGH